MINTTTIKVPKKYEGMIQFVEKDCDGYWAYSLPGFYFPDMGCHTAHEDTQAALLEMIRTIKPCDCKECADSSDEVSEPEYRVVEEESFGRKVFNVERNFEGKWFPWVSRLDKHSEATEAILKLTFEESGLRFIGANFNKEITSTESAVINAAMESNGITLYGFKSKQEAEELADKFPKYIKPRAVTCTSSTDFRLKGIHCEYTLKDFGTSRYTDFEASYPCQRQVKVTRSTMPEAVCLAAIMAKISTEGAGL